MVDRVPVQSSNIRSIGHDPDTNTLTVEFNNGSLYDYHDVPKDVHEELIAAKSVGGHLNANIKGVYKHVKKDAPE